MTTEAEFRKQLTQSGLTPDKPLHGLLVMMFEMNQAAQDTRQLGSNEIRQAITAGVAQWGRDVVGVMYRRVGVEIGMALVGVLAVGLTLGWLARGIAG